MSAIDVRLRAVWIENVGYRYDAVSHRTRQRIETAGGKTAAASRHVPEEA